MSLFVCECEFAYFNQLCVLVGVSCKVHLNLHAIVCMLMRSVDQKRSGLSAVALTSVMLCQRSD